MMCRRVLSVPFVIALVNISWECISDYTSRGYISDYTSRGYLYPFAILTYFLSVISVK